MRLHLPRQAPEGCAPRATEETRPRHEARNRGATPKAVLLLDFAAPDLVRYPPKPKRSRRAAEALFGRAELPRCRPGGAALEGLRERA